MIKTIKVTVAMIVLFLIFSTFSITTLKAQAETQFNDLTSGDFGFEAIINLYERGVIEGFPGNEFRPTESLKRAQAAVMFQRALALPIPENTTSFKDVENGMYYTEAVAATLKAAIFEGNPDGTFGPNQQLTREQMASLLVRSLELEPIPSNLVKIYDFDKIHLVHQKDVLTLYQNGITNGKSGNLFDPKGHVTRAEFSVFVVRGVGENLPPKIDENVEEPAPIAGGGAEATSGPQVSSSYLLTSSTERFNATVGGSDVTFTIPKGELANLTTAKITVSDNSTMTVRVFIGDNVDIDEERTQELTAGENDLDIAATIRKYADTIDLIGSFNAQGTLVDDNNNSSNINLIFNIIN